jgi:hypothetical protein
MPLNASITLQSPDAAGSSPGVCRLSKQEQTSAEGQMSANDPIRAWAKQPKRNSGPSQSRILSRYDAIS